MSGKAFHGEVGVGAFLNLWLIMGIFLESPP